MSGIKVVDSVEQSTMASSWTEHLCSHKSPEAYWTLDIRGFEVIGETHEYDDKTAVNWSP